MRVFTVLALEVESRLGGVAAVDDGDDRAGKDALLALVLPAGRRELVGAVLALSASADERICAVEVDVLWRPWAPALRGYADEPLHYHQ